MQKLYLCMWAVCVCYLIANQWWCSYRDPEVITPGMSFEGKKKKHNYINADELDFPQKQQKVVFTVIIGKSYLKLSREH